MSARILVVVLCVLGVASAAPSFPSPRKIFCTQCKGIEDMLQRTLETSVTFSEGYFTVVKQTCTVFPGVAKDQCDGASDFIGKLVTGTIRTAEERPCEVIYRCKPYEMNAGLAALEQNPEGFCRICKGAVSYALESLGIEAVLEQGSDIAVQICQQLGLVSEEDCEAAVKELMKKVELPDPKDICAGVGLCGAANTIRFET